MKTKKMIDTLNFIYLGVLAGLLAFSAVFILVPIGTNPEMEPMFKVLVPVFAFSVYILGVVMFRQQIKFINPTEQPREKVKKYRIVFIIRLATIEGGALFAAIAYGMTKNLLFLIVLAILIALYLMNKPGLIRIINDLGLTNDEVEKIKNGDI